MNCPTAPAPPSSTLTARIARSFPANERFSFSRVGISSTHGGHHVAQKWTMTTLPRSDDRLTAFPDDLHAPFAFLSEQDHETDDHQDRNDACQRRLLQSPVPPRRPPQMPD